MSDYTKKTSVTGAISDQINYALGFAKDFFDKAGKDLVITSLADSQHMVGSLHYEGQAVDIRTKDLTASEQQQLQSYLSSNLHSQGYDVILESNHLHIEYDPKTATGARTPTTAPTTDRPAPVLRDPGPSKAPGTPPPLQAGAAPTDYNFSYKLPMEIKKVIILGIAIVLLLVAFSKLK